MAQRRTTLIYPPIEDLLDKVDSKFTLVSLSAKRARQINSYYNQLGEGMGVVVPPQVASVSGKPLTIAFEEIASSKATFHHPDPNAVASEGTGETADLEGTIEPIADSEETGLAQSQVDAVSEGAPRGEAEPEVAE